jgi:hypothetical protein
MNPGARFSTAVASGTFSIGENTVTRDEILQAAADAVAREWLFDEQRAARYDTRPNSYRMFVTATNALCRFDLEQQDRHRVIYDLAPALLDLLRDEQARLEEAV